MKTLIIYLVVLLLSLTTVTAIGINEVDPKFNQFETPQKEVFEGSKASGGGGWVCLIWLDVEKEITGKTNYKKQQIKQDICDEWITTSEYRQENRGSTIYMEQRIKQLKSVGGY